MSDTIAAISTAMTSSSAIGIVRMSGEDALTIADQIFRGNRGKKVSEMRSHTIHYGYIHDQDRDIDEVLLSVMRAPHTYTREDVVEINCHGGLAVTRDILGLLRRQGARIAQPGEFTKRAFLNGRIDLTQAEAVMDMIQSKSRIAMENSLSQLKGRMKDQIQSLREQILHDASWIEASVDDPEHIEDTEIPSAILKNADSWISEIDHLIDSAENGKLLREGIRAAIAGKPNAGKSSVLNYLLGEDRAIVTEIEGTTRDSLTEQLTISGIPLILTDTAGIRSTDDRVEKIGVDRARAAIDNADLVFFVADRSRALDNRDREIAGRIREKNKKCIVLLNKSDLDSVTDEACIKSLLDAPVVSFSAKEETGLEQLEDLLKKMFFKGDLTYDDQVIVTNERHLDCLQRARDSLSLVTEGIRMQMPVDMLTIDLMEAYSLLGEMIGEAAGDDLIDEIFRQFCMGK